MNFWDVFGEMLVILFAIAAGYAANRLGYLGGEADQKVSKLLLNITMPAMIVAAVITGEELPELGTILSILEVGVVFYLLEAVFALVVPRFLPGTQGQKGGLVRVDLLYNKFPVKVRCGINIATAILVLICMGLVFIYGINIFLLSFRLNERISSVWGSPMWTIRFWVPLGAALMFIQAISELIKNVAAMAGKIELTNNSDEVAEAIEIVKSAEHLPDETGKEDIQ